MPGERVEHRLRGRLACSLPVTFLVCVKLEIYLTENAVDNESDQFGSAADGSI